LLRPGVGQPALLPQRLLPHDMVGAVVVLAGEGLLPGCGRQVRTRESADFVGERLMLGLEVKIHESPLPALRATFPPRTGEGKNSCLPPSGGEGALKGGKGVIAPTPSWR